MPVLKKVALFCAGAACLIGVSALNGWFWKIPRLKSVLPEAVPMNPTTAIAFIFSAVAVWLLANPNSRYARFGRVAAGVVAAIGTTRSIEYLLGIESGIDRILFADRLNGNHMAPNTAAGFALAGLALLLLDIKVRRWFPGEILGSCFAILAFLCVIGYAYDAKALYGIAAQIPMALNTAIAFEFLAIAILGARPERGIMGALTSPLAGGMVARRLLPLAVILPACFGWLITVGQSAGLYDSNFADAVMITVSAVFFAGAVCWTSITVNKADAKQRHAEDQLKLALDELEDRVAERTADLQNEITERKRTEEDLKQRDDQLRQAQKMEAVGTLAGGVAHEFNNLLQAIQAYTRFGMEGLSAADQRYQDLEQVLNASNRASALTRQLLGFGRRQAVVLTNIAPNQLITDLVKMVRPLIGANINIEVKLGANVGTIHADAGTFQQLLMNLCVNARDAMPDGGTLLVRTEDLQLSQRYCQVHPDVEPGRYLALSVSDTGTGMSPEIVEHIFEPFFTTKGVGKGTGLGLAQVYGVVQQHKGVIRVYSEVGKGTTFKIYLPTVEDDATEESTALPRNAAGGKETILIAEDEPLVLNLYGRILGTAGYRLLTATNGQEAWEVFQAHRNEIDLLVLDVIMPEQGGRELHRKIQQVRPEIPVIFCSGYDPETAHARFIEEGDHPFIQKPFDPEVLVRTVRQVLDQEAACSAN